MIICKGRARDGTSVGSDICYYQPTQDLCFLFGGILCESNIITELENCTES